ncbi:unnamed protein product [Mytilus coruscus]|uniref:Fibronectin type-III domain-containing protein n=1 Tax=Mytilus coruscus TaxID=42192 RepID=A0A6J8AI18_MYTCO|nr:unnamed protein product [Mytilus coruscus]
MRLYSRKMLFPHRYKHSISCFHQWIVFLITIFVRVQCVTSLSDNLMWNITSNPVKFGNTAELSCYIFNYDTTCTDELRQWIGGIQYTSLCQNMICSDGTKYQVKLKTACSYTLMITVPRIKHKNMSLTGGFIDIHVSMEDVFPSPKCHALLAEKNITNSLLLITSKKEYFYDVDLQVNHPIHICEGNATIYCYLGKEEVVVLNEYIDDCSDIATGNCIFSGDQVAAIIAGVVVAVISICIGVFLCWKKTRRNDANEDKPSAPLGPMSIYNITDSSADIEWQAPEHDGGGPVEQYQIQYRLANTPTWKEAGNVDSTTYNFSVKNLKEYQDYYFRVTAINNKGPGFPLESGDPVKLSDKPSAPVGPMSISNITDSSVYIEWQASTMDGGAPVEQYQIQYRLANTPTWEGAGYC